MTPENQAKLDAKWKRIRDAVALTEPDRIPITPSPAIFPYLAYGYTVAEVNYDTTLEKAKDAYTKFLLEFDPDNATVVGNYAGEGPLMELQQPTTMRWAGMPGDVIPENSLQQYVEFPMLLDDEFEEFFNDRVTWEFRKNLPRGSELLKPLERFSVPMGVRGLAAQVSAPDTKKMIETLWKINEGYEEYQKKANEVNASFVELGYPIIRGGGAGVPFDGYSDFLRGTILSLEDLYTRPEDVRRYIDATFEQTIAMIKASKGINDGTQVFMALHKGMDGFMSDEQYRKYYWSDLQAIIEEIIKNGMTPYIYTEGDYNTRLDCLKEVTAGKVIYHFETVDMANAKKVLGDTACISGGFPVYLLEHGTRQQVIDEAKRLIDICAPGGGFIFETNCGLDNPLPGNLEALMETVREYGKY